MNVFLKSLSAVVLITLIISKPASCQLQQRLTGNWEFIKQDLGGVWEAIRPVSKDGPEAVPVWTKVTIPHCFNSRDGVDPSGNYYQGPGWYRSRVNVDNPFPNGRTILHFEGAGQNTEVYVYDVKVASHRGGYDEWRADITDAVAAFKATANYAKKFNGNIPIVIRCSNARELESIPSRLSDFNVYGGIYRYLNLAYEPEISIERLFAEASLSQKGNGQLKLSGTFYGGADKTLPICQVTIYSPKGTTVKALSITPGTKNSIKSLGEFTISHPEVWSPASPSLYTAEVKFQINGLWYAKKTKFGFRNFLFKNNGPFYLNGKKFFLKGTHRHEDASGVGAAMTEPMIMREMQMIKDMGANFIRLGHYQQSHIVLEKCDSLGLLVWEEAPWCRGGLGGNIYQDEARDMLTNMIRQHFNHPSIILWGLGNENDWEGDFKDFDKEKIRNFMKKQNELAHELDPSRKTVIRRCDFCKDIPDIYSPTIWAGWYRGLYTQYKQFTEEESSKVSRFFHAEWGGDSHAGRHSENEMKASAGDIVVNGKLIAADSILSQKFKVNASKDGGWSETYICNLFDWHLKEQASMPFLTGSAFWTFKDFATPLRPDNPLPFMNQKGVVESDLTPKESFYVVQSYWSEKPMAHIYGHSWPVRWGKAGEEKLFKVYTNCDEAELFLNNKSLGIKRRETQNFPAAGMRWSGSMQKGINHLRVVARKGGKTIVDTLTQIYQTNAWGSPGLLVLKKYISDKGIITVQVNIKDKNGVFCPDAANLLNFTISGDGVLLDDLGTVRGSRKLQAYNGRASISVNTGAGRSIVGVSSPGIPTAFIEL